ncbi:unnamed protein product [Rotaria magnacalcarata]|uniref:Uncharacterized protein n=7 Tax=Rotaria magnacalcarata TaxID=392030 RepID=A0A816LXY6_9BILA|nr:unnamed protein product [Rotaria magnacalcarata]
MQFLFVSVVGQLMAWRYYPVCNTPCRTGGHVQTCCRVHGFGDGYCGWGVVGQLMAWRYYPVCNTPCRTGGHVQTCCRVHGFGDGYCGWGGNYAMCG